MARTVKVGLSVDEAPFVRGMKRAEAAAEGLEDALDDVAGSAKDTAGATGRATEATDDLGDSAKDTGRDLDRLRADAARLDRQIDQTASSVRDLARAIAATSDEAERAKLGEKLAGEQGRLRSQVSLRKLIDVNDGPALGEQLAQQTAVSFGARFGPLLARVPLAGVNPAVLAIGAPLVAGLVTLVGTAAGGAIVGGAAGLGIAGGLKLAAKDPAVKAAGTALGADLSALFGRASSAFVPATLGAIDTVRERALGMEGDFNRVFSSAARYVDPLVDGLFDAAENAMPGLIDAVDSAGPVIETIANGLRDLGSAIGEGLSDLAPYADEGARALDTLFFILETGTTAVFDAVENMSRLYKVAELVGAVLAGDIPRAVALTAAWDDAKGASEGLTGVLGPLANGIRDVGKESVTAEQAAKELKTAFDELFGGAMSYDRALIAYRDGVRELNKELREGKRTLDTNTQAGRDNSTAVLDQIERIKELRDTRLEQGESIDTVNAKYQSEIGKIRAKLKELGYEKSEIDALIGKYQKIPEQVATKVSADTIQAQRELAKVRDLIARIQSKRVVITTQHNEVVTRSEGRNVPIGGIGGRRWGGIVEHAQWGTLREAQIAAPVAPARYAWAEPATGGEAFVPRFGDPGRSIDILSKAARWYGQQVVPAGVGGGGVGGGLSEVRVFIGDQELRGMVRVEVAEHNRGLKRRVGAGAGRI